MTDNLKRLYTDVEDALSDTPVRFKDFLFLCDPDCSYDLDFTGRYPKASDIASLCMMFEQYPICEFKLFDKNLIETSIKQTCFILKNYKDILWDIFCDVTLVGADWWSVNHEFFKIHRRFINENEQAFEFLNQGTASPHHPENKTVYEFMKEVVPSALNLTGGSAKVPIREVTKQLFQHLKLLLKVYAILDNSKSEDVHRMVMRIVRNQIWLKSFSKYTDDSVRESCSLIGYSLWNFSRENKS